MADKMWHRILYGAKWDPAAYMRLAVRALDLKDVNKIKISIDPFHPETVSIR